MEIIIIFLKDSAWRLLYSLASSFQSNKKKKLSIT